MKLITISGIDGSGKTTQANLLEKYLVKQGKKVHRFHAVSFSIANKILKRGKDNTSSNDSQNRSVTQASFFQIFLRKIALLIDLIRFKKYFNELVKQNMDYLISDRYFFDGIINILFLEKKQSFQKMGFLLNWAKKSTKKPDYSFFIKIKPEIALSRDREIDQGIEYLKSKALLYSSLANHWQMNNINGEKSQEEIFKEIKSLSKI